MSYALSTNKTGALGVRPVVALQTPVTQHRSQLVYGKALSIVLKSMAVSQSRVMFGSNNLS